jgi:hypothetical protein
MSLATKGATTTSRLVKEKRTGHMYLYNRNKEKAEPSSTPTTNR